MHTDAAAAFAAVQAQYKQTFEKHLANGVNFISDQVWIDPEVEIAPGATILPGCILRGNTKIGAGCVVGPNSLLENTELGEGSTFNASQAYDSRLGANNKIGPCTHIRPDTVTGPGVHLGAYVETKNSGLGQGTTVSHLTYVGDSDVGEYCNFGCGTVTSNYDGEAKYRCKIGDFVFLGCNTNLIAPSPAKCPPGRWPSPAAARPTRTAGPRRSWAPTSPRRKNSRRNSPNKTARRAQAG